MPNAHPPGSMQFQMPLTSTDGDERLIAIYEREIAAIDALTARAARGEVTSLIDAYGRPIASLHTDRKRIAERIAQLRHGIAVKPKKGKNGKPKE